MRQVGLPRALSYLLGRPETVGEAGGASEGTYLLGRPETVGEAGGASEGTFVFSHLIKRLSIIRFLKFD